MNVSQDSETSFLLGGIIYFEVSQKLTSIKLMKNILFIASDNLRCQARKNLYFHKLFLGFGTLGQCLTL